MISFDITALMFPTYKCEYDWKIIGIDDLRSYVQNGSLTKAGFKEITGDDYEAENAKLA